MQTVESKIDRVLALAEEQELRRLRGSSNLYRDVILNTILASITGYFIFRVLDIFFRKK